MPRYPLPYHSRPSGLSLAILLCMCLLLSACKVEVNRNLSEEQANLILATLLKRGVAAKKSMAGKDGFIIQVDEQDLVKTLEILQENSLPQEHFQNLGNVFPGQGMIASATEEEARMSFARAQELSDTFSRIDGVLTARVHVVLKKVDEASNVNIPPAAAVFIRHTPGSIVTSMEDSMREVTAKSVPGLAVENIAIMLVPVRESISVPMSAGQAPWTDWLIPGLIAVIMCVLGGIGGFIFARRKHSTPTATTPPAAS